MARAATASPVQAAATGGSETIDGAGVNVWAATGTGAGVAGVGVTGAGVTGVNAAGVTLAGVVAPAAVCHLTDEGVSSAATNPGVGAM